MKKNKFLMTLVLSSSCLFALASCQGAQGPKGDQGEPGINGTNGTNGTDGKNGSSVLTGTGVPASTLGNDGDSYIDTETFDFYSKNNGSWSKVGNIKGSTGEQGEIGSQGEEGKKGTSLLSGSGVPSSDLGNDGDSYIDTTTFDFYSKANGEWKKYGNFKGSDGQKGEDGTKGEDGKQGTSVLTGSGEPASTLGNDGDSYIDTSSFDFYTKADGAWTKVGSIKGDKGDQGEKGDKGNSGWSGSKGDKGDTAWSNTILYSEYGYITPSAGSALENEEISFTVHQNDYDNHRLTGLTFKNPSLDDEEKTISIDYTGEDFKVEKVDGTNDYTFTTTMLKGGFVVSANFASKNLTVSLPKNVQNGSISLVDGEGATYFPGDTVKLKITFATNYRIKSFTLNGNTYDKAKLTGSNGDFTYEATIGEKVLDIAILFEEYTDLEYSLDYDENGDPFYIVTGIGGYPNGTLSIPEEYDGVTVKEIAANAFNGDINSKFQSSITSIVIPNTVTKIGDNAFSRCYNANSITIGNNVESIGQEAFYCCNHVTSITIPKSVTSVKYCAFYGMTSLKSVTVGDGTIKFENRVFWSCDNLETFIISKKDITIGESVFLGCNKIKIYYNGVKENIEQVKDSDGNDYDTSSWYFYSETEPEDKAGKYWYYKENVPTSWNNN